MCYFYTLWTEYLIFFIHDAQNNDKFCMLLQHSKLMVSFSCICALRDYGSRFLLRQGQKKSLFNQEELIIGCVDNLATLLVQSQASCLYT